MDLKLNSIIEKHNVSLTKEQYEYVSEVCFGDRHVANWSEAGTGKSLCVEIIKEFLGDSCIICATTGVANSILFNNKGGNGTCHSVFALPIGIHNKYHEEKSSKKMSAILGKSDLVRVIVIEEAGMLTPDQLALIIKRITKYNKPYGKKRKKRNIKLVLNGDLLQAQSIMSEEERKYTIEKYGNDFLPLCNIYKELNFKNFVFTQVMRTHDRVFKAALSVLRYGEEDRYDNCLKWLNKRYIQNPPKDIPIITTTNKKVNEINESCLSKNSNMLFTLYPEITGEYDIKNCPVDPILKLKEGCPVLILINDFEFGQYFNGSFGYVDQITIGEGIYVKLSPSGRTVFVPIFEFEEREYFTDYDDSGNDFMNSRVIGKCKHYCVKLCYAASVHRSQGKTLDTPYILDLGWGFPYDGDWGAQLAYIAWSRSTKVENIFLDNKMTKKHIKVNRKAVEWVKSQKDYSEYT